MVLSSHAQALHLQTCRASLKRSSWDTKDTHRPSCSSRSMGSFCEGLAVRTSEPRLKLQILQLHFRTTITSTSRLEAIALRLEAIALSHGRCPPELFCFRVWGARSFQRDPCFGMECGAGGSILNSARSPHSDPVVLKRREGALLSPENPLLLLSATGASC